MGINKKIIAVIVLFTVFNIMSYSQVTDAEKALRTQSADTLNGLEKRRSFYCNLAQTSLTNWVAGGQNSSCT